MSFRKLLSLIESPFGLFFYFQLVLFHLVIKPFSFMALSRNWWLMMTQNTNGLTRLELLGLLMKHDRGFSPNFQVFDHICFSIWYIFFYYQFLFLLCEVKRSFIHSFIHSQPMSCNHGESLIYLSAIVCLGLPRHLLLKLILFYN